MVESEDSSTSNQSETDDDFRSVASGEEEPRRPNISVLEVTTTTSSQQSTMSSITSVTSGLKIEVPKWDGKKDTYATWKQRFVPFAAGNRFATALKKETMALLPEKESTALELLDTEIALLTDEQKPVYSQVLANNRAILCLTNAFYKDEALVWLQQGMDENWPELGKAYKVMSALDDEFNPSDLISQMEMSDALDNITMQSNDAPSTLTKQFSELKLRYNGKDGRAKLGEALIVSTLLRKAPKQYRDYLAGEVRRLGEDTTEKELIEAMNQFYRIKNGGKGVTGNGRDLTLSAFSGECYKCGKTVALSTTEAELDAASKAAQDMLFIYKLLVSLDLKVELPMLLDCDNSGTKDLINNWNVSGRMRHVEVKKFFLRDLKEENIVLVVWVPTNEMTADLFTKNLAPKLFNKHAKVLVGRDEYMVECEE